MIVYYRITSKRRAEEREKEERLQRPTLNTTSNKSSNAKQINGNKGKGIKSSYLQRRRDSLGSEEDEADHHPGNYSPTSAMRDYDEPNGINGDNSRRSSLRSSSIIGIDGDENPGPGHTLNPLDGVTVSDKSGEGKYYYRLSGTDYKIKKTIESSVRFNCVR